MEAARAWQARPAVVDCTEATLEPIYKLQLGYIQLVYTRTLRLVVDYTEAILELYIVHNWAIFSLCELYIVHN